MNRDEILTKLAMELGEWPLNASQAREMMPDGWYWRGDDGAIHVGGGLESFAVTAPDWLQRRAELINRPSWDDAPEWAQWLAQDADGEWRAFKNFPKTGPDHWFSSERISKGKMSKGTIPNGHDWRQTLEARPDVMTPEEEELPAQEKHDCPRCGGCFYSPPHDEYPCPGKQERYRDQEGDDWIDEFARTSTVEEFRGAMRFTIGKYNRRMGKKDEVVKEIRKMRDYCDRWLSYEVES